MKAMSERSTGEHHESDSDEDDKDAQHLAQLGDLIFLPGSLFSIRLSLARECIYIHPNMYSILQFEGLGIRNYGIQHGTNF